MKKVLLSLVLVTGGLLSSSMVSAEPATTQSVKNLMELTGSANLGVQMFEQLIPALKKAAPNEPESFWDDLRTEFNPNDLQNLIIPIYQKHFTEADIQAINDFYQTPAGKKMVKVMPDIMQESFIIGQQWGQKIAQKVITKYQTQQ